jgi:hypothetical protein
VGCVRTEAVGHQVFCAVEWAEWLPDTQACLLLCLDSTSSRRLASCLLIQWPLLGVESLLHASCHDTQCMLFSVSG